MPSPVSSSDSDPSDDRVVALDCSVSDPDLEDDGEACDDDDDDDDDDDESERTSAADSTRRLEWPVIFLSLPRPSTPLLSPTFRQPSILLLWLRRRFILAFLSSFSSGNSIVDAVGVVDITYQL